MNPISHYYSSCGGPRQRYSQAGTVSCHSICILWSDYPIAHQPTGAIAQRCPKGRSTDRACRLQT